MQGEVFDNGRVFRIAKALRGYPIALRLGETDGLPAVYFRHHEVAQIDLHYPYK